MDIHEARQAIAEMAAARGYGPDAPREWRSPEPEHPAEMGRPPLFYAALRPRDPADDMPLGLGATPEEALADLLWTLAGPALAAALAEPEAELLELAAPRDESILELSAPEPSAGLSNNDLTGEDLAAGDEVTAPEMSAQ
jgi:hypothetical protein